MPNMNHLGGDAACWLHGCRGLFLASCQGGAAAWGSKWFWFSVRGTWICTTWSRALVAGRFYLQPVRKSQWGELLDGCVMGEGRIKEQHRVEMIWQTEAS